MKLLIIASVVAHLVNVLPQAPCQDNASTETLSLAVGRSTLQANSIERGLRYPSVIQLKGSVQITIRTVVQYTPLSRMIMVVRADEADYHEDSGEIEARGNVQVSYRNDSGNTKHGNVRIKLENRTDQSTSK